MEAVHADPAQQLEGKTLAVESFGRPEQPAMHGAAMAPQVGPGEQEDGRLLRRVRRLRWRAPVAEIQCCGHGDGRADSRAARHRGSPARLTTLGSIPGVRLRRDSDLQLPQRTRSVKYAIEDS